MNVFSGYQILELSTVLLLSSNECTGKRQNAFFRVFFLFGLLHATAEINALFVRVHHVNKKMILGTLTSGANVANAVYFYKTSFNCKMHFYVSVRVYCYFHVHIGR